MCKINIFSAHLQKKCAKNSYNTYNIPIIGIEPAIKPAVESKKQGKIIIMATTYNIPIIFQI